MIRVLSVRFLCAFIALFALSSHSHAQLSGLLGGGDKNNPLGAILKGGDDSGGGGLGDLLGGGDKNNPLGGLLKGGDDSGSGGILGGSNDGSGGMLSNPAGLIGQTLKSAQNTNLGPVGRFVLGRELSARMLGNYNIVDENDPRVNYLQNVAVNLLSSSRLTRNYKFPVVILLDEPETVNAFATPGGFIFISTGMLDFLQDEDELAFVLAHEIAHIEMDHGLNAIRQNEGSKLFQSAAGDAGSDLFGQLLTWGENGFSKDLEQEADLRGGQIAGNLGYDYQAGIRVIDRLEHRTGHKHGTGYPEDRAKKLSEGAASFTVSDEMVKLRAQRFAKAMGR